MTTLIAVAGPPGAGKTHWIARQLAQQTTPCYYYSPRTEALPLDAAYLQAQFPDLHQAKGLPHVLPSADGLFYLELPWQLDLAAAEALLQAWPCQRVAVVPAGEAAAPWQAWADTVVGHDPSGMLGDRPWAQPSWVEPDPPAWQFQRGLLGEERLEAASLDTFWLELSRGAYGRIRRAKGLFYLQDSSACWVSWTVGQTVPPFWHDLPPAPSDSPYPTGLEVIGLQLEGQAIAQTLQDCCLPAEAGAPVASEP